MSKKIDNPQDGHDIRWKKRFVQYSDAMEIYSMSRDKIKKLAIEANALYRIDQRFWINCQIFEDYLEKFHLWE